MSKQEKPDASGLYHDRVHKEGRGRAAKAVRAVKSEREKRIADNIRNGCPPWLAHVATDKVPADQSEMMDTDGLYLVHDDGTMLDVCFGDDYHNGEPFAVVGSSGYDIMEHGWPCTNGDIDPEFRWFVRITRDGPTRPWEVEDE